MYTLILLIGACARDPSFGLTLRDTSPAPATADSAAGGETASVVDSGSEPTAETGRPTGEDTGPLEERVVLEQQPLLACADPGLRAAGPAFVRTVLGPAAGPQPNLAGGGLAVDDLDGDGDYEILHAALDGLHIWQQVPDGGLWSDRSSTYLPPGLDTSNGVGLSTTDLEGDGDVDVLLVRRNTTDRLFRNEAGRLEDVTAELGLSLVGQERSGSAFADLDLDGDLDLIVPGYGNFPPVLEYGEPSQLYLQQEDGTFQDVSDWLELDFHLGYTFMGSFYDVDDDLYPDLFNVTDFPYVRPSRVYQNRQGTGFDLDLASGFQNGFFGMGVGFADLNGDGLVEIVQSSVGELSLLLGVPSGEPRMGVVWVEIAPSSGLVLDARRHLFGWGIDFADVDNDGDLDVPLTLGYWAEGLRLSDLGDGTLTPDLLFVNQGGLSFREDGEALGFADLEATRGLWMVDLNRDGWLDAVKAVADGPALVLEARCGAQQALEVRLIDETRANREAVGARVTVQAGGLVMERRVMAGSSSLFSDGPPVLHFGLGEAARVDQLTVRWPDGREDGWTDLAGHQELVLRRRPGR